MIKRKGRCSCGDVVYVLYNDFMFVHTCHCNLCRKITGSAFIINGMIEGSNFNLKKGSLENFIGPSGSGKKHNIKRCKKCGDPIVSYFGNTEHLAVVKIGSLDRPENVLPQAHIFVSEKLEWVELKDTIPKYDRIYDFESTWPVESFERLVSVRQMK